MRKSALIVALLAFVACNKNGSNATPDTSAAMAANTDSSTAAAKAAIDKLRDDWKAGADKKDAATVASYYTEDAVLAGSNAPVAKGRDAIQKGLAPAFAMWTNLKINSEDVKIAGDWAVDMGTYSEHVTPPKGKPMDVSGNYIVILKKQADGSWKLAREVDADLPQGK